MSTLEAMKDCEGQNVVTSHKEERIKGDTADSMKIHEAVSTCIDVLKVTSIGLVDSGQLDSTNTEKTMVVAAIQAT